MSDSTETPWTPGPWRWHENDYGESFKLVSDSETVLRTSFDNQFMWDNDANARLIAAAPRMAKLLERVSEEITDALTALELEYGGPAKERELIDDINTLLTEIKDG